MAKSSVKISASNQTAIPKQVRSKLKLQAGDHLLLDIQDGLMIFLPFHETFTQALAGLNRKIWENSEEYILRERNSWIDSTNP
jgi:AbrB family looped-hinge helix DNA binding protein